MGVNVREKKGHLYLDIYQNGRRNWEALGLSIGPDREGNREARRIAEAIRQKREQQLVEQQNGLLNTIEGKKTLLAYVKEQAEGRGTGEHIYRLIKYIEGYDSGIQVKAITPQWIDGFKKHLATCPVPQRTNAKENENPRIISKRTQSHMFKALGQVLALAVRDRLISHDPSETIKGITVPEKIMDYLDETELQILAATPLKGDLGLEIKRAFVFACLTGLRISDLRSLTWGQVSRTKQQIQKIQEKTGRIVFVPLTDAAMEIIKTPDIAHHDMPVFPLLAETGTDTNKTLLKWATAAGITKKIGWHTARRTNATLLLEGGADVATVSRLLGHSGVQVTMKYAQSTDKVKKQAVNGLPKIEIE
ncbi:phage integrase family site specific recombinase [Spirochaetia bacterium]|nr:phage integrase family site specific recombinase [Spirochaetia bacterium]